MITSTQNILFINFILSLAIYHLKRSVSQTAATNNIAYLALADGLKTLVWDLDPQGSSSFYMNVQPTAKNESKKLLTNELSLKEAIQGSVFENLWIIPADLSARNADVVLDEMKQSKKKIKNLIAGLKHFDLVIFDCPPGISLLHDNIFNAADWILMPNIPTTLSIRSFETVMEYMKENDLDNGKIRCFFSMVDHRKNLHHEVMQAFYKDKLIFKNYIPYLCDVEKIDVHQQPFF